MQLFSPKKCFKRKKGMTLMEILVVASLMSLIGIAIYNSLSNGIRIWRRTNRLALEEDIAIFFEKISSDLRNSFFYSKISFEGDNYSFSFPAVVRTLAYNGLPSSQGSDYVEQIGKIEYYFDPYEKTIYRRQANYSQALKDIFGDSQVLAESIESVKFRYYYLVDKSESISNEVLEVLPSGVEIEVEFFENQSKREMTKFINIPVAS